MRRSGSDAQILQMHSHRVRIDHCAPLTVWTAPPAMADKVSPAQILWCRIAREMTVFLFLGCPANRLSLFILAEAS